MTKIALKPLRLTVVASAADAEIHKKTWGSESSGSGIIILITWNEEMKDSMKILKSLEDSGLLINKWKWK